MTVLHTGSTKKFSDNWEHIFGGQRPSKRAEAKKSTKKSAQKSPKKSGQKSTKKAGGKQAARRKK